MKDTDGLDQFECFGQRQARLERHPLAGVPHPVDRETIPSEPIEASERRIELPPIIGSPADAVALHEAVAARPPVAANVDRIVESIAGFDLREKTRFQDLRDERLTAIDDAPLFQRSIFAGRAGFRLSIQTRFVTMVDERPFPG